MKKILIIFLCVFLLFGVVGCGKLEKSSSNESNSNIKKYGVNGQELTDVKAEIVTNDGKTEQKSWAELNDLLEENDEYFKKHYGGAKVKITDTVYSIDKNSYEHEIDAYVYQVVLSSGWYVYIDQNANDLSEVLKGTKVEIESYIYDNSYWPTMHGKYSVPEGEKTGYGKARETTISTIKILSD